jgi:hypothetical protein
MADDKSTTAAQPEQWVDKGNGVFVLENSPPPEPQNFKALRKELQEKQLGLKSAVAGPG